MKNFMYLICSVFFIVLGIKCGKAEDDNTKDCGDARTFASTLTNKYSTNEIVAPGLRDYYYEDVNTPVDICADELVDVVFEIYFIDSLPSQITSIKGKAYWGLGDRKFVPIKNLTNIGKYAYKGTISGLDLKPFFGPTPGWIGLSIIFTLKSIGDIVGDRKYIESSMSSLGSTVYVYYRKVK